MSVSYAPRPFCSAKLSGLFRNMHAKRDAIRNDELIEAFTKSGKTYDEVLKFLRSRSENEETDRNEKRRR